MTLHACHVIVAVGFECANQVTLSRLRSRVSKQLALLLRQHLFSRVPSINMAEKYDWRLKDPRYRKVFSNFLRNRPYGDDWRYSPVQLHGVKRGTAAAAAAAAAGRGCQQQDAAKRTSLPSTSRTAEDEIRQRQGGGDGNDNNNNNTYTTDKPKKPMKRRNTIAADHVVVTGMCVFFL